MTHERPGKARGKPAAAKAVAGMAAAALLVATPLCAAAAGRGTGDTGARASGATATAPANVNMEMVMLAAQVDPQRDGQKLTPGAERSVTLVERALHAKDLLEKKYIDGHFGTVTVDAYAQYQRSLGYEGLAATGLPGKQSLRSLGEGRFDVTRAISPGERTKHDGKTVNTRTKAMLVEAERVTGRTFDVEQGSYNPGGDPTSAGTHDGGGAVDLHVDGMGDKTRTEVVKALRQVGFAAWMRTADQGDWPPHIHAMALNDPDLAEPAQEQTGDYYLGKNGLANERPDDGPQVEPIRTWEGYQRNN